jgi:MinD-like ATPase involved in chromosome partitioning or flagellar assembly
MCNAVLLYSWPDLPVANMGGPVSSTDPHHDDTQIAPWQYAEQTETPDNPGGPAEETTPSWLGYQPEPAEYTPPPAYPQSPPAHDEYSRPQYVEPRDIQPEQPQPEVPAGAGMVPPRSDAVPPAPAPSSEQEAAPAPSTGWSATDYSSAQSGHTDAPERYRPADVPREPSGPVPRPEDLLLPDRPAITEAPAQWGWRGRVNRLSAGAIKPTPKPAELADRQAVQDIQRGFSRPMTVVVIQPKGGAGKTPTAIGLASALGASRGGYVVAWDDNETRGTLAVRVVNRDSQQTTVWDLLGELASFERADARVGDLGYYVRSQGEAYFDALVSDDHPAHMAQIGEDEFHRIHAVLQRFYRLIVIDTGNNVRSPNWQAAVNAADVVVIPSTYQRDVGYSGSWVLDHLIQTGREELAEHSVTVLTAADPDPDRKVRKELLHHFGARTQNVVEIPHDPHIATGGPMHWNRLNAETRRAWIQLGAVVVHALAQRDQPKRQRDQPER